MSSQEEASSSSLSECLSAWRGTLPREAALDADRVWRGRWASGGLSGDDHMVLVFRGSYVNVRFFSIHSQGYITIIVVPPRYDGVHCLPGRAC